jgi:hypothetical protein
MFSRSQSPEPVTEGEQAETRPLDTLIHCFARFLPVAIPGVGGVPTASYVALNGF